MSTDTLGANATVSPADQRALLLWDRRREKRQAWEQLGSSSAGTEEACEAAFDRIIDVEHVLEDDMRDGSIHALGAVLLTEIEDNEDLEACAGLYRGALRAIRPQLVGEIAAAADRVLAQGEEARS